jgi:lipoyl(octanoyl) transferase
MNVKINKRVEIQHWGEIRFQEAWEKQESMLQEIVQKKVQNRSLAIENQQLTDNYLVFCKHPHVFTLGKSGKEENLLLSEQELRSSGIDYFHINRGGDITYHGPGQLVCYPIFDLENFQTDLNVFLRNIEEAIIQTIAHYGIVGDRIKGLTGVWVRTDTPHPEKIAAIGIRCSRWVSMHGLALNVNTDLSYFSKIIPCGITDKGVTSIQREIGKVVDMQEVEQLMAAAFQKIFVFEPIEL